MNSDTYEFAKSSAPQGVDMYTPYQEKQWNYLNDINSGVYSNNSGLTNVQFDLTSIYNSGQFCDATDLFLTIPIVMTAATSGGAAFQAPVGGHSNLCTLKSNFQHLIHQIEIVSNGKTVNDTQPFISLYENFKLLSAMSVNDLKQFGSSFGLGEELDNEKSVVYTPLAAAYTPQQGVGLCNNRPFVVNAGASAETQPYVALAQNTGVINKALARRATRVADATLTPANSFNKLYGTSTADGATIMTAAQLANEFKPNYQVIGNINIWYDLAVIPLKYLCDVVDKMGLVKKLDMILRIYFNTGSLSCTVANGNTGNLQYGAFVSTSTFANTCPFTVNHLIGTAATGGLAAATTAITAGVFIARAPTTSITAGGVTVNLGLNVPNHPMPSCRCYYSLVKLEPSRALAYIEANREKQVVFENVIFNQYNSIGAGSSFSQLVQSGIKNPLGVCIIPLIGSGTITSTANGVMGFEQWQSPYDTCPSTYSPISLTNLQVSLGGQNQLASTLYYTFETFLEQVALAENLTSSDFGVGSGLINQNWWETVGRVYWVDLSRGRDADKASMRNLSISFNNNSQASITLMVFTVYLDKITIDVETGIVKK
jgi:hypothetical protein